MPFFDKLKAVFIVPEPSKSEAEATGSPQQEFNTPSNQTNVPEADSEHANRFLEILAQVLEKNNQPGFDYLEFRKAVQSIAQLQHLEEVNQFKTAYAAAQALNIKADSLIQSAKTYLNILESEQVQFNKTADQYLQNQLSQKKSESDQLKKSIIETEEKLKQLQLQLDKDKAKLSEVDQALAAAKSKVDSNKAAFSVAYKQVEQQIRDDVRKMENYLT